MSLDRPGRGGLAVLGLAVLIGLVPAVPAAARQMIDSRQVTLFGLIATPNSNVMDPKLKPIAPQLRKLFPNHGFKLVGVENKRLSVGQVLTCNLGQGFMAGTELVDPLDLSGKVQLKFQLDYNHQPQIATMVTTPPNQLFFADKILPDGTRLVLGIGAR